MGTFDKKKIIVFSVLLGGLVIFFLIKLKPDQTKEKMADVEVKLQKNSLIASKLEAYKKNREAENRERSTMDINQVSFYGNGTTTGEANANPTKPKQPVDPEPKPEQPVQTSVAPKIRKKQSPAQPHSGTDEVIPAQQENITAEEKSRRRAMLQESWGKKDNNLIVSDASENSYPAVVHGKQEITTRGSVQIRLKEEIHVKGYVIPANTLITGIASFTQDRLNVLVNSVRVGRNVIPVSLAIYGSDGLKGIPVQVDETKQLVDKEVSHELLNGLDQAASGLTKGLSSVVTNVAKGMKKQDSQSTILYDNTSLYIKIISKK